MVTVTCGVVPVPVDGVAIAVADPYNPVPVDGVVTDPNPSVGVTVPIPEANPNPVDGVTVAVGVEGLLQYRSKLD